MANAEHSSPSSTDALCAVVCSSSDASPLPSSLCCAYGGPIASIASLPTRTDKPPAYRPICALAINAAVCSSSDASPLLPSLCCTCGGPTTSVASPPPWTCKPPAYHSICAPAINDASQTNIIILTPVPQPLPIPPASPSYHFETPTKRISSSDDLRRFHSSANGCYFHGFITALSHSIRGRKLSESPTLSHPSPKPLWPLWHGTVQAHVGHAGTGLSWAVPGWADRPNFLSPARHGLMGHARHGSVRAGPCCPMGGTA